MNIQEIAKKNQTLADIMVDREKGTTEELIDTGVITINNCENFDMTNEEGQSENLWAFTCKEHRGKFFFAGTVMKNIFVGLLEAFDGDYIELYNAIEEQGLKVKFENGRTKKGRPITKVTVI